MTNQDDFDLVWPEPLSLSHYRWIYEPEEAPDVIRCAVEAGGGECCSFVDEMCFSVRGEMLI